MTMHNMKDLFDTLKDIVGTDVITTCDPNDVLNRIQDAYQSGRIDCRVKNALLQYMMYTITSCKRKGMIIENVQRNSTSYDARKALLEKQGLLDTELKPSYGNKIKIIFFDEISFGEEE